MLAATTSLLSLIHLKSMAAFHCGFAAAVGTKASTEIAKRKLGKLDRGATFSFLLRDGSRGEGGGREGPNNRRKEHPAEEALVGIRGGKG